MSMIYFDNAATTYPKPECVYEQMDITNRSLAFNAGRGSYALAQQSANIIDNLRKELLRMVNASNVAEVVLSSSATFALNQIIGGLGIEKGQYIYISPYEHNAVVRTIYNQRIFKDGQNLAGNEESSISGMAQHLNWHQSGDTYPIISERMRENSIKNHIIIMPLKADGSIDIDRLKYEFSIHAPSYVFMTHVSNVTGYILPIEEITAAVKEYGAVITVDGSQALGLVPFDMARTEVDFYVFAGHKTPYGPFGIGGFFIRNGRKLDTFIAGGTGSDSLNVHMPEAGTARYEPASPNVVAAAGLLAAVKGVDGAKIKRRLEKEINLTNYMVDKLKKLQNVRLYLPPADRHVGIVALNVKGYKSSDVGMILDADYNIAVRTGYHCAPLVHEFLDDREYLGVVRASISMFTTTEDIDALVGALRDI